ncbi:MotA/TolQ/ExbB proton channel family protein [Helicobacter trogontum]|uniref:MotA/TolQ/ExbB proton channel family protein n=2 Tax=Helicobacter trogontum TaxID=50960 RepID=A0A4U8SAM5_9HELI|nr:MotA/TolQ/ExbB proton channel family protein [Helicobacter trogontum]TLD83036.1 MotA/TolQ/ExbB proton channel family protein [Helicobacter trogontum]
MKLMILLYSLCLGVFFAHAQDNVQNNTIQNTQDLSHTHLTQDSTKTLHSLGATMSFRDLYEHADYVVKTVIYILLLFSVLTWCVFVYKILQYYFSFKMIKNEVLELEKNNLDYFKTAKSQSYTKRLIAAIEKERLSTKECVLPHKKLCIDSLKNRLRLIIESTAHSFIAHNKRGVALLASIGSSAPFIGLFGTVWGIMNSFIGIASSNNASLSAVAPGISEALFATAFGLVAAIPAVLFYNYLIRLGINFGLQMDQLVTRIYILSDREISQMEHA